MINILIGLFLFCLGVVIGSYDCNKYWRKKYYQMLKSKEMSEICINCGCQEWDRQ